MKNKTYRKLVVRFLSFIPLCWSWFKWFFWPWIMVLDGGRLPDSILPSVVYHVWAEFCWGTRWTWHEALDVWIRCPGWFLRWCIFWWSELEIPFIILFEDEVWLTPFVVILWARSAATGNVFPEPIMTNKGKQITGFV